MAQGKISLGRSGLWRPTVYPYLEQLAKQLDKKSETSVSIDIEGVRILVTPLEQELVLSMLEDEETHFERKHILVRDGLGLRVKLLSELNSLAQESSKKRGAILEAINEDIGLGFQLMHEITLEMRSISGANQLGEAREFSQYRQQLSRTLSEAERRVANRSGMTETTDEWTNTSPAPVKTYPAKKHMTESKPEKKSLSMFWVALALIIAGAAAAWFFLFT